MSMDEMDSVENTEVNQETSASEVAASDEAPEASQDQSAETQKAESNVPFNEHPRFQELISQKNEMGMRLAEMEKNYQKLMYDSEMRLREIENRVPKQQPVVDEMYNKLKDIDPAFADYLKGMKEEISRLKAYENKFQEYDQWKNGYEQTQLQTTAESTLNRLYQQHGVNEKMQPVIRGLIESMAFKNEKAGINDLPAYFKQAYDLVNGIARATTQNYVVDKRKDQVPASSTSGAPVKPGVPRKLDRSDIVSMLAKEVRANKQSV